MSVSNISSLAPKPGYVLASSEHASNSDYQRIMASRAQLINEAISIETRETLKQQKEYSIQIKDGRRYYFFCQPDLIILPRKDGNYDIVDKDVPTVQGKPVDLSLDDDAILESEETAEDSSSGLFKVMALGSGTFATTMLLSSGKKPEKNSSCIIL